MQTIRNVNVTKRTTDWQNTNWRKAHRIVRNLSTENIQGCPERKPTKSTSPSKVNDEMLFKHHPSC